MKPIQVIPSELGVELALRLLKSSHDEGACRVWHSGTTWNGYGQLRFQLDGERRNARAHRVAWMLANGQISDARLVVDHLCKNRRCINPDHLELVTQAENLRRGDSAVFISRSIRKPRVIQTHCKRGHELDGANVRVQRRSGGGWARVCRACERWRESYRPARPSRS